MAGIQAFGALVSKSTFPPTLTEASLGGGCDHPVFRLPKEGLQGAELPQVAQRRKGRAGTEPQSSLIRPFILSDQAQRLSGELPRSSRWRVGPSTLSPKDRGSPSRRHVAQPSALLPCLSVCSSMSHVCAGTPPACSPDEGRGLPVSHCLLCFLPAQAVTDP